MFFAVFYDLGDPAYLGFRRSRHDRVRSTRRRGQRLRRLAPAPRRQHERQGRHLAPDLEDRPGLGGVVDRVAKIIEKPPLSQAELELNVPGLRMGYYLCVFGMHALQPRVFEVLEEQFEQIQQNKSKDLQLTPALHQLAIEQSYLALEMKGRRYDLSGSHGLLQAQMALGLAGNEKEEVLTTVLRLLAEVQQYAH